MVYTYNGLLLKYKSTYQIKKMLKIVSFIELKREYVYGF